MIRNPTVPRRESPVRPAGSGRSAWRAVLEAGASIVQDTAPLADGEADEGSSRISSGT